MLEKIKEYLKSKWNILKPILIKNGKAMLDLIVNFVKKVYNYVKDQTISLIKKLWDRIKLTFYEIKTKILIKELAFFQKIAQWLFDKADALAIKLFGELEDLDDLDVVEELDDSIDEIAIPE